MDRTALIDDPSSRLAPLRVAVIDDDMAFRRALERLLRGAGFEVESFPSAEDYLHQSRNSCHRCLVLDIYLGGMSGLELLEKLRLNGIRIPTVLVTAHEDLAFVARAAPGVRCLRKPFDEEMLFEAIALATGEPRPQ